MFEKKLTDQQQALLEQITDEVVEDFYREFDRPRVIASLVIDPAEIDRAIELCLASA